MLSLWRGRRRRWRVWDPVPKETWRYNVLENDELVENI